ncbi:MAG: VOC family protein [Alphaproteobacteria bacterium]
MLNRKNVAATIAVKDLQLAIDFYEGKLGLIKEQSDEENYTSYKCGTTSLLVYQSAFAGGYQTTVATWSVGDDLEKIVADLKSKSVTFEHYDMPGTTLKGDIHTMGDMRNAWFKDPDGNIICLVNA